VEKEVNLTKQVDLVDLVVVVEQLIQVELEILLL
jgi:hypothetical protein